jgi:hypothetical protein
MKARSRIRIVRTAIVMAVVAGALAGQTRIPSPDGKLYAVSEEGPKEGKGQEIDRFGIFTAQGTRVSVIHIWLTEPDGTGRVGIRGCERSGWIDSKRFYCEGSINPSTGIYRWFDATAGKELGERGGSEFTWSPDGMALANFGNVPHFMDVELKCDSLEFGAKTWAPEGDKEQHWFRSAVSWSPDSRFVAVIDHQRRVKKAFFLEILEAKTGAHRELKLQWPDQADEWYPDHDFDIEWTATQVTVRHDGKSQSFAR